MTKKAKQKAKEAKKKLEATKAKETWTAKQAWKALPPAAKKARRQKLQEKCAAAGSPCTAQTMARLRNTIGDSPPAPAVTAPLDGRYRKSELCNNVHKHRGRCNQKRKRSGRWSRIPETGMHAAAADCMANGGVYGRDRLLSREPRRRGTFHEHDDRRPTATPKLSSGLWSLGWVGAGTRDNSPLAPKPLSEQCVTVGDTARAAAPGCPSHA